MPGAPVAMAFLTVSPITLVFASLVENEHSGTTLSEMWSMLGLRKAGVRPEKERPGLLLPQSPDDTQSARRRPADVFLPALAGGPAALDFAITAHQRQDTLALASSRAGAAAEAYARQKEAHLHTAQACASQGVSFVPMVVETTGHWDVGAARVLRHIATAVAARTGDLADHVHTSMLQELCVVVRSFRARAALRRRSELADA